MCSIDSQSPLITYSPMRLVVRSPLGPPAWGSKGLKPLCWQCPHRIYPLPCMHHTEPGGEEGGDKVKGDKGEIR